MNARALTAVVAVAIIGSSAPVLAGFPCNYDCDRELGGCFTCDIGSSLEDCHVSCYVCWGSQCFASDPPGSRSQLVIERIHVPSKEVLGMLDPPYQRVLEAVLPQYNSERSLKHNPVRIQGGVVMGDDLFDPTSSFTLTVEQDDLMTQVMVISVDTLGAAELTLDPAAGEVTFRLTYNDGRRSIAGRGALAP